MVLVLMVYMLAICILMKRCNLLKSLHFIEVVMKMDRLSCMQLFSAPFKSR